MYFKIAEDIFVNFPKKIYANQSIFEQVKNRIIAATILSWYYR